MKYNIEFKGLKEGLHDFGFEVDNKFFEHFEESLVESGKVKVNILLEKRSSFIKLHFKIKGWLELTCDRCLDLYEQPIKHETEMFVKFGENESDDRHNFAISTLNRNGIFVKNSIEENIYMPTFEGDVGGIDVLQGASNLGDVEDYKIIKDDLFAGLLIPKSYLTFEEDLCLRGNTEILTNNGLITIKELSDNWINGQKTFVLSCNKYGYITPGKVLCCKETKETNVLYKIFINETKYEETTENHPFLMDDLTYKSASELNIGDKLRGMYEKEYFVTDIKIEVLDTPEKVYDLEVEEYHNFALSSGVFVHNSNKAALAQEDMRFAGAIKQYQGNFIEALLHIAIVHLTSKGFSVEDLSKFELEMNTNSKLVKKLENETLQQKVDLAKSILDTSNGELTLLSFTQVSKYVMNFSDEQIPTSCENQLLGK